MTDLLPLEALYDSGQGEEVRLPAALARLYGELRFPTPSGRPYVISNFVTTLDGVASLGIPGQAGGGPISGFNQHDRLVMAMLRAVSDAVVVGAGTLRSVPNHVWTPDHVFPSLAEDFGRLRQELKKSRQPLNVIVTATGDLDSALPVFQRGDAPVLIATTREGAKKIASMSMPTLVQTKILAENGPLRPNAILDSVSRACSGADRILIEGGPHLLGDFLADGRLDELFLTLSPQVAGRDGSSERPGIVAGRPFAPDSPLWAALVAVKRAEAHLFLRYSFG
jgi:riboflavin biosynthesis pyrimidine reductase